MQHLSGKQDWRKPRDVCQEKKLLRFITLLLRFNYYALSITKNKNKKR